MFINSVAFLNLFHRNVSNVASKILKLRSKLVKNVVKFLDKKMFKLVKRNLSCIECLLWSSQTLLDCIVFNRNDFNFNWKCYVCIHQLRPARFDTTISSDLSKKIQSVLSPKPKNNRSYIYLCLNICMLMFVCEQIDR